jgi:RimJ/RimL family protein N-acetyltransferase
MIRTERLLLRPWRAEDRAPFLDICTSPSVMAHLGGPMDAAQVDAAIGRVQACQAAHGFCFWAVERRADEVFLGFCGFKIADAAGSPVEGELEIGWRFGEAYWGQGYAREAASAALAWGWDETNAPRVIAMTVMGNSRSWGLMERLGLKRAPALDFGHPNFAPDHPLHRHIVYAAERPAFS